MAWAMVSAERQRILSFEIEEAASQLARTRSPALALRLRKHARATAGRLLRETGESGRPKERALLLMTLAEIACVPPPGASADASECNQHALLEPKPALLSPPVCSLLVSNANTPSSDAKTACVSSSSP